MEGKKRLKKQKMLLCFAALIILVGSKLYFSGITESILRKISIFIKEEPETSEKKVGSVYEAIGQPEVSEQREELWCKEKNSLQNGAFCSVASLVYPYNFDWMLCASIENVVKNATLLDLGAAVGYYGSCFLRRNLQFNIPKEQLVPIDAYFQARLREANLAGSPQVIKHYEGYDGGSNIEAITNGLIKRLDLEKTFDLGRRFDWVLNLEVGEHIPQQYEETFLDNVTKHACKGVIISWAIPGQGGLNHINNKPNKYVLARMGERGFYQDLQVQDEIRKSVKIYYFTKTVMVFRRIKQLC